MSKALQAWAMLVLLMAVPLLASADAIESGSAEPVQRSLPPVSLAKDASENSGVAIEPARGSPAPVPAAAGASDVSVVEIDAVEDPLLDAEFDEAFESGDQQTVADPFENLNRVLFKFNRGMHRMVLSPITKSYQFVAPEQVRKGVRRILINFNSPSTLVNDLLQFRVKDAGETLGRFLLNSTIGFGGLFDVAVEAGWKHHSADFGQTLARIGVDSGPYLVVPILGPNTVRDGLGGIVDLMFQPLTYLVGPSLNLFIGGGRGFVELETNAAAMEALEGSSVDYYAALRSAYIQNRRAEVELPSARGFE